MTVLAAIPVINCQTIELTLEFYQQLFQFVVIQKRKSDGCLHWVLLKHGSTTLMLKRIEADHCKQEHTQNPGVSLYLYVNNINDMHHFIKAKNRSVSDLVLMKYQMYEFKLLDPEGNMITVGQSVNRPNE